jgi:single-stranded DNA-binding protein
MRTAILHGRIVSEIKVVPMGKKPNTKEAVNFTMYCDHPRKKELSIDVATYGPNAEYIKKYAAKGDKLIITGEISVDRTEKGTYFRVIAETIERGALGKISRKKMLEERDKTAD